MCSYGQKYTRAIYSVPGSDQIVQISSLHFLVWQPSQKLICINSILMWICFKFFEKNLLSCNWLELSSGINFFFSYFAFLLKFNFQKLKKIPKLIMKKLKKSRESCILHGDSKMVMEFSIGTQNFFLNFRNSPKIVKFYFKLLLKVCMSFF